MINPPLTIEELLDRALESSPNYDEEFAEEIQSLLLQACSDREALGESGVETRTAAAQQYVNSWSAVLNLFADDPVSLAALTAPRVEIANMVCGNDVEELFTCVTTPTMIPLLYEAGAQLSLQAAVKGSSRTTKLKRQPAKKSKKQIKAKPKATPKAKPKSKAKPKTTAKKAKKTRRR